MTTQKLMAIVKDRGITIAIKEGRPVIVRGQYNPLVTDELLAVLKIHKERIIALLTPPSGDDGTTPRQRRADGP